MMITPEKKSTNYLTTLVAETLLTPMLLDNSMVILTAGLNTIYPLMDKESVHNGLILVSTMTLFTLMLGVETQPTLQSLLLYYPLTTLHWTLIFMIQQCNQQLEEHGLTILEMHL